MLELESVRLIHAHGLPNHYIANQIYVPTDGASDRGTFLLLIHHANTANGMLVSSAITTLIRDYYRPGSPVGLDGFEHSLLRVNEQLKHTHTNHHESHNLEGLIVLFYDDEIHLSYLGNANASLIRDGQLLPLTTGDDKKEEAALAFSVITSGEVKANDILFLSCGLSPDMSTSEWDQSLQFAANHEPLYETGRALARITQQSDERAAESLIVRFNTEVHSLETIAIDKSLETTAEKMARFQKGFSGILSKVQTHTESLKKVAEALPKPSSRHDELEDEEELHHEPELKTERDEDADTPEEDAFDFSVKTYRQKHGVDAKAKITPPTPRKEADEAQPTFISPFLARFENYTSKIGLGKISPRILYLFVGILVLLIIIIITFNRIAGPSTNAGLTTTQRDALVTQAEASAREADSAQAQDDSATAITKLTETETTLAKIPTDQQNEASKALSSRTEELLKKLTNSSPLTVKNTVTSQSAVSKIVTTPNGTYIFGTQTTQLLKNNQLNAVAGLSDTFIDATPFESGKKLAILSKASNGSFKVTQVDTSNNQTKDLIRTDGKPWPTDSRLIASFESNLYLVGSKITKTIPSGDKYLVVNGNFSTTTSDVKMIINNDVAFYGNEGTNQIVRIAAGSDKTNIKLFGVPDSFWPKTITRLLSTGQTGQLYILDTTGNRILLVTTDGGYKQQFTFPNGKNYTDCDASGTTFTCVTNDNKIDTLQPSS